MRDRIGVTGEDRVEETAPLDVTPPDGAERRIAALERALAESQAALAELRATHESLQDMLMHARTPICMWRGEDLVYSLVNPAYVASIPGRQLLGRSLRDVLREVLGEEAARGFWDLVNGVYRTGNPFLGSEVPVKLHDAENGCDELRWFNIVYAPVRGGAGEIVGVCHYGVEITDQVQARRAAEARAEELQQSAELIAAQQETIRVLGTPVLPLAKGVLAMPLIGPLDARRSEQIMEGLLHGVTKESASVVILDVTGVETIDAQAADAVVRAARAVRLLGARVLVTGIQPSMAQVLVQLGVDLRGITTYSTLQSGIAAAMGAS
ncbi:STAS domain-containing protein [Sorangium sp. So ce204]|uniref:STAS domain-containing protein n=1 Tax=Sorangium sp. So ce204 TaxID=3133288 RepID=UPI003F5DFEFF